MKKPKRMKTGSWLVVTNSYFDRVDIEDPRGFTSRSDALKYIDQELESYPGIDYYLCRVDQLHSATISRHVKQF